MPLEKSDSVIWLFEASDNTNYKIITRGVTELYGAQRNKINYKQQTQ